MHTPLSNFFQNSNKACVLGPIWFIDFDLIHTKKVNIFNFLLGQSLKYGLESSCGLFGNFGLGLGSHADVAGNDEA